MLSVDFPPHNKCSKILIPKRTIQVCWIWFTWINDKREARENSCYVPNWFTISAIFSISCFLSSKLCTEPCITETIWWSATIQRVNRTDTAVICQTLRFDEKWKSLLIYNHLYDNHLHHLWDRLLSFHWWIFLPTDLSSEPYRGRESVSLLVRNYWVCWMSYFTLIARGIWSTYWGLMIAFKLSSRIFVK